MPLIGARKVERLDESPGALEIELSEAEMKRLENALPADSAAGTRYDAHQMSWLDSEKQAAPA